MLSVSPRFLGPYTAWTFGSCQLHVSVEGYCKLSCVPCTPPQRYVLTSSNLVMGPYLEIGSSQMRKS